MMNWVKLQCYTCMSQSLKQCEGLHAKLIILCNTLDTARGFGEELWLGYNHTFGLL